MQHAETESGGLVRVTRYAQLDDEFYIEVQQEAGPMLMVVVPGDTLDPEADAGLVQEALGRLGIEIGAHAVPPLKREAGHCRRSTSGTFERME